MQNNSLVYPMRIFVNSNTANKFDDHNLNKILLPDPKKVYIYKKLKICKINAVL